MTAAFAALVSKWQALRAEWGEIEQAEHPDLTDRLGRVWVWKAHDTYVHDGLIAIPRAWIATWGLPSPTLADNPNYADLCDICRSEWLKGADK